MSNEAITAVSKSQIKPSGRKFVAMALADYADEQWSCFPSVEQIAKYTSQGEKTVRDHLDALEHDGIITRNRHRREDGTLGRYRFVIHRRKLPVASLARGEKRSKPPADFAAHNPHIEPPINNRYARARGTRLPEDWVPSPSEISFATGEGLSFEAAHREANRFRDYWIAAPGQRGVKRDWSATWRNWVRKASESSKNTKPEQRRDTKADRLREMNEFMENG